MLERGEWVVNRERISPENLRRLAVSFSPDAFDAEAICDLAVAGGMRYVTMTTMHHEGFRLYESELTDFHAKAFCGRDLVQEIADAARARGLHLCLYHSLNNWYDQPDACDALESSEAYDLFIANTFARLKELTTRFAPFDVMWYDACLSG